LTDTRYARNGDLHIAYQVLGDAPLDLLYLKAGVASIDSIDELPEYARFIGQLASFSRVIRFDLRGVGLSDPIVPGQPPTMEEWVSDAIAVLDALDIRSASLLGGGDEGALVAIMLAAARPERVSSLVIVNGAARLLRADDYPIGVPPEIMAAFVESSLGDTVAAGGDDFANLRLMAPSYGDDPRIQEWWRHAGQRGASPGTARAIFQTRLYSDLRDVLPAVHAPTLVLHRMRDAAVRAAHGRYLASHIDGAKFVELDGDEHLVFLGDIDVMVAEIQEFLTGVRHEPERDRVLATLLFCDIVESTAAAVRLGDRGFRSLLSDYHTTVRRQIERHRGRIVKTMGDGLLVTLDGPARGIRCAQAIRDAVRPLGVDVRIGLHTGEVELMGDDVGGIAVHIASRVCGLASGGEILVSSAVPALVAGSGIEFEPRGEYKLRGVPGTWAIHAVAG
jgi:class 3 adenylate cyclase